jgi:hypothetical protein
MALFVARNQLAGSFSKGIVPHSFQAVRCGCATLHNDPRHPSANVSTVTYLPAVRLRDL